jgi:hypothetical protein
MTLRRHAAHPVPAPQGFILIRVLSGKGEAISCVAGWQTIVRVYGFRDMGPRFNRPLVVVVPVARPVAEPQRGGYANDVAVDLRVEGDVEQSEVPVPVAEA